MKYLAKRSQKKYSAYLRRKKRANTKAKIRSTKPRLLVFRSNRFIYAQIIGRDGNVLATANDMKMSSGTKSDRAFEVGMNLASIAKKKGLSDVVFDRNGFLFHGRVKQLAEGARKGGLSF